MIGLRLTAAEIEWEKLEEEQYQQVLARIRARRQAVIGPDTDIARFNAMYYSLLMKCC